MYFKCILIKPRVISISFRIFRQFNHLAKICKMDSSSTLQRLESKASKANELIRSLDREINEVKKMVVAQNVENEVKRLKEENAGLRIEIEAWKSRLIAAEMKNGIKQISIPGDNLERASTVQTLLKEEISPVKNEVSAKSEKNAEKKTKAKEKKPSANVEKSKPAEDSAPVDVSRLDFRIGRIISAKKHPDADSLYVEEVELGEDKPRTVVSGLVKFVPLEEMQNRIVMLLCNLKPAKMRGVLSQAMVMCASTPEKVEILEPPPGATPGDRVKCEEFPGEPDKELNPKKKIFDQVAPDLKTDDRLRATYKGKLLVVPGKGVVIAPSLANVQIK